MRNDFLSTLLVLIHTYIMFVNIRYLGIIRDCYEAYAIYMFLSFLIAVLGKGDRNVVVDVLTEHVDHLPIP